MGLDVLHGLLSCLAWAVRVADSPVPDLMIPCGSLLSGAAAEVLLNSDNQPIPLKDFVAPHLFSSEGTELLPPHVRR